MVNRVETRAAAIVLLAVIIASVTSAAEPPALFTPIKGDARDPPCCYY